MLQTDAAAYTPTWGGTGVSLGDGTLAGNYARNGDLCTCTIAFQPGSTTNFGSGDWSFTLPFTSANATVGSVWMQDTGSGFYVGSCLSYNNIITCYTNSPTLVKATHPFTWVSGDVLFASITFRVA